MLLYILMLRRHHRRARAACRTMWTRNWIDWRQRQGVGPICKTSKKRWIRKIQKRTCMRVYSSCEYGNMGVCCACVRVCICERVLTIVFWRVGERPCVHGYAHKYYLLL